MSMPYSIQWECQNNNSSKIYTIIARKKGEEKEKKEGERGGGRERKKKLELARIVTRNYHNKMKQTVTY